MRIIVLLMVLFMAACGPVEDKPHHTIIQRQGNVIWIYRSGGNCIYVYGGYGIAAAPSSVGGC